ncbi:MAG: hypothetical protein G01um101419_805 [Parcubacteria group bacterium Gr01-1014_19]|nr:MAG: hypothetical protein G01um101419_805 [Parcubacteria group bacterium Gr01-1014_19]
MELKKLIGMTEPEAVTEIQMAGMIPRVRARDGKSYMVTMDARDDRVNLWIVNGTVTRVSIG